MGNGAPESDESLPGRAWTAGACDAAWVLPPSLALGLSTCAGPQVPAGREAEGGAGPAGPGGGTG